MKTNRIYIAALFVIVMTTMAISNDLPSAEKIIAKYVQVAGDEKALSTIKNRLTKSTLEFANQGVTFDMTIRSENPNAFHLILSSEQFGTVEKYADDKIAWEYSVMKGPRLIEGSEKDDLLREARFDKWVKWKEIYAAAETTGEEEVDGVMCYRVKLQHKDGQYQILHFAKQSGLLAKVEARMNTDMGTISFDTLFSDYRNVDGLMLPFKSVVNVLNQRRIITVKEIEHNLDFSLQNTKKPDEVELLLAKSLTE